MTSQDYAGPGLDIQPYRHPLRTAGHLRDHEDQTQILRQIQANACPVLLRPAQHHDYERNLIRPGDMLGEPRRDRGPGGRGYTPRHTHRALAHPRNPQNRNCT